MENKYYWLKLKRDFFKRHDIRIIESMENGKDYILFYLKLLCESVDHNGSLRFSDQVPYNDEMLSVITDTNVDIVRSAVKVFTQLDMMELLDDGTLYMTEVSNMIGSASNNDNAIRQQRYRDKKKQEALPEIEVSVTKSNASVTECVTNNNESKSKNKNKSKSKSKNIYSENEKLDEVIHEFIEHRKAIKNPMTELAITKMLNKLDSMTSDDEEKIEILNQSILNGWKSVYPLKNDKKVEVKPKRDPITDGKGATGFSNFENRQYDEDFFKKLRSL